MSAAFTVARKELRALFESPVALLFLGFFELVTLLAFFEGSRFFARNLADVRPLFEWLPLLLVLLTSAVTMRAWAEERKLGTLEVLMTLPVRTRDLVLGKFLAAVALVGVALLLTLPLPIMVSVLGPLDVGPVVGGYIGALLLGALYVSLGLCISARTDNQVVSLMLTLLVGGALWLVGTDTVTGLVGNRASEVLRAVGTGARFESIARGVLDARDLVYYGGLTAFFLVLNGTALEHDRVDADSPRGRSRVRALWALTALVGANALAADVWLAPVTALRADLTENGDYSISPTTRALLAELDEPLYLEGYFSERTHPKLAPLVPQIRDLLEEYEVAGGGKVHVAFADPNADEQLEAELAEKYGIRSVPFQVDDRHEQAVVNSFFQVLVRYGDQYRVLSFDDLVEIYADSGSFDVRLRNLEYDVTKTIKKVSQDFQTLASVLADLPEPARLTLYATPSTLPDASAEVLPIVRKVAGDVVGRSGGKLTFEEVDPSGDPALQERIYQDYGLRPLATDLLAQDTFYFELVLSMGKEAQRLSPRGDVKEADLQQAIEASVRRLVPGQLTTIGLLTEIPVPEPPNPQIPPQFQPPPPRADYQVLAQLLGQSYEVKPVDLSGEEPAIDPTVDVLLVGKAGALSPAQQLAIDQYLMRGGRVIALAGSHRIQLDRSGLSAVAEPSALRDLLARYGVKVGEDFVLDAANAPFPRPVEKRVNGMVVRRIELEPYPFFVDVRQDAFERGQAATSGLGNATFPWGSPLEVAAPKDVAAVVVAKTSPGAWTYAGTDIAPSGPTGPTASFPVAVTLTGRIPSAFAEGQPPVPGAAVVKESVPDARLAVLGSSEMVGDLIMQLAGSPGGEVHRSNAQLVQNLVDWSTEDTELLEIRTSGAFARTLAPLDDATRNVFELAQYVVAVVLLAVLAGLVRGRRRSVVAISLKGAEAKA